MINVTGSFVLGLCVAGSSGGALLGFLGTGMMGGYTTFSTASVETVRLIQQRRYLLGVFNAVITAGLSVAAAAAGLFVMSL